ncbi:MAG TPA: hypothetical protein VEC16_02445 [Alphaproteobacteria bacterium]|nr:hypothetical protein [Alphaproteobacteria bacterium]
MKTIVDPKENELHLKATCAIVSRKPALNASSHKTAVISLYPINNPHMNDTFPTESYEFTDVEKIRIKGLNVSYYLEGNDIVINDLEELLVLKENKFLVLKGYQFEIERRRK